MGTQLEERNAHLANMRDILAKNFGEEPPAAHDTKRSGGLDPQCGVIVGLRPRTLELVPLATALANLGNAWAPYNTSTLHLTLGDQVDRNAVAPTDGLAQTFNSLKPVIELPNTRGLMAGSLANPQFRVSADTIVLTGEPDAAVLDLRDLLLTESAAAGIRPGWSSGHLTVARLKRQLLGAERDATIAWLKATKLPKTLPLDKAIVGLFMAGSDSFGFVSRSVAEI